MQRIKVRAVAAGVAAALALGSAAGAVAPAVGAASSHRHLLGQRITIGTTTCAPHWRAPNPGIAHFVVRNDSGRLATVYFFQSISGHIIGRLHNLAPHSHAALVVHVKPSKIYSWGCDIRGRTRHVSESERVPRHAVKGGPGKYVPPVQSEEMRQPLKLYRIYVANKLKRLQTQVQTLSGAVAAHDLTGAESAWLTAHLTYLRIGQDNAAYGAFGTLGAKIDGNASGLVHGTADPKFTGFHKVELDLWGHGDLASAMTDTETLQQLVSRLAGKDLATLMPANKGGETDFTLRSHEITEDAIRDSLSDNDDYGSGTSLASVTADATATKKILRLLAPLILARSPHLVGHAQHQLHRLTTAAAATQQSGAWVPLSSLTRRTREQIDADTSALAETLAPVPDLLRLSNT